MSQLRGAEATVPVAAPYPSHAITSTFRLLTAYPYARSVKPVEGAPDGRTATTFVKSGRNSWAETRPQAADDRRAGEPGLDKGDVQGPVSLAVAVSAPAAARPPPPPRRGPGRRQPNKPETRLVVIGDSDFATNGDARDRRQPRLFLNIVNWLAQQENLISVRPRDPRGSPHHAHAPGRTAASSGWRC